ncbi:MAG: restriction endonuclease subunit S [Chloroflexi bacterium]|nr:restriction endonuclease subunit S [Chloroflexota bacterium]
MASLATVDKTVSLKVHFGDVVRNVDESVRDPQNSGLERYVGLEHIDPESLHIQRWGLISEGTSFTRRFRKGQVLFGKRRAYQRKVAVAGFDGLCSSDILVFEPKDDRLLPELLPFICQSDGFFEHALDTSAGSLSPRTKFKELARYEFPLPPLDEQRRIAEILWAADEVIISYKKTIEKTLSAMKSYRYEIFSEINATKYEKLGSLYEVQLGKTISPSARKGNNLKPYLCNINVQWDSIDLSVIKQMSFNEQEEKKYLLKDGDILVCEGGEVGRAAIWNNDITEMYYQNALHRLRPIGNRLLPEIFIQYMMYAADKGMLQALTGLSTIAHLTTVKLKTLLVPIPSECCQAEISCIFSNFKNAINAANISLNSAKALKNELMNQFFLMKDKAD